MVDFALKEIVSFKLRFLNRIELFHKRLRIFRNVMPRNACLYVCICVVDVLLYIASFIPGCEILFILCS